MRDLELKFFDNATLIPIDIDFQSLLPISVIPHSMYLVPSPPPRGGITAVSSGGGSVLQVAASPNLLGDLLPPPSGKSWRYPNIDNTSQ